MDFFHFQPPVKFVLYQVLIFSAKLVPKVKTQPLSKNQIERIKTKSPIPDSKWQESEPSRLSFDLLNKKIFTERGWEGHCHSDQWSRQPHGPRESLETRAIFLPFPRFLGQGGCILRSHGKHILERMQKSKEKVLIFLSVMELTVPSGFRLPSFITAPQGEDFLCKTS